MNTVTVVSTAVVPRLQLNLIAGRDIENGEVIVSCSPSEITRERTWRTIQVDFNRHLKNELLDYVDHSCDPNAVFVTGSLTLVALRPIAAGESITFFYPGAEVELAQDFLCRCGSPECIGHVKGGFYLTPRQWRWALDKGYCTEFMGEQFRRLLGSSE
jgi:hypothetical protein